MTQLQEISDLRDHDPRVLESWAASSRGVDASAVRRLLSAVVGHGHHNPAGWGSQFRVPKRLWGEWGPLPRLHLDRVSVSAADRFEKLLFRTGDGHPVETVLIPLHKPGSVSVCVSSQVGCAMGCTFCATARMSARRSLATWEMVDQVVQARERARVQGQHVTGAVFMGMGEPFLNYDRVLAAAELLSHPYGGSIAGRSITISTVGLVREIDRFTDENRRFRLSISLGAATDAKRAEILPIASRTPVGEVMSSARRHVASRGGRVMLSYVCIAGFNCGEDDAEALGHLIGDTPVRLVLIDVTDPTGRYEAPGTGELNRFRDALTKFVGQPVVRRYSGGAEIDAACGTLAGRV
jgi:23S rRNA (adenine2503-C2)-methyltransferase